MRITRLPPPRVSTRPANIPRLQNSRHIGRVNLPGYEAKFKVRTEDGLLPQSIAAQMFRRVMDLNCDADAELQIFFLNLSYFLRGSMTPAQVHGQFERAMTIYRDRHGLADLKVKDPLCKRMYAMRPQDKGKVIVRIRADYRKMAPLIYPAWFAKELIAAQDAP